MKLKIKSTIIIIFTILFVLLAIVVISNISEKIKNSYLLYGVTNNAILYKNNKILKRGIISQYDLTGSKYGDKVEILCKIPEINIQNPVLQFNNTINAGVEVYVNDELVYEKGMKATENSVVCNNIMNIPLKYNCSNKFIKIVLRCTNEGVFYKVPDIIYINSIDSQVRNIISNISNQVYSITLIGLGIISLTLFLFNIGVNINLNKIIFLSLGSIFAGIWVLSCYQLLNVFVDNDIVDFYAEYISIYMTMLFINLFVSEIISNRIDKIITKILRIIWCIYTVVAFTTQILNIWYMNDSIIGLHLISIPLAIFLFRYYKKRIVEKKNSYLIIYGCSIVIVTMIILYSVTHAFSLDINVLANMSIILLLFIVCGFIQVLIELRYAYASTAEKEALMDLIYIDKLTGINNRRGLDEYDKKIRREGVHCDYRVYSVDLNRLKYVNDNFGHAAGDKLIKSFAETVKEIVDNKGFCGRMGGDEFVIIIKEEDYQGNFEKMLKAKVDYYNQRSKDAFKLMYSIGSAEYSIGGTVTIDDCIRLADYNMYEMKSTYKSRKEMEFYLK